MNVYNYLSLISNISIILSTESDKAKYYCRGCGCSHYHDHDSDDEYDDDYFDEDGDDEDSAVS